MVGGGAGNRPQNEEPTGAMREDESRERAFMAFNGVTVRLVVVSAASAAALLSGPAAVAGSVHSSTAGHTARQIGPWEPSVTRDPTDGDPGGVSGSARLQRFNTASPSGIEFAEITFKALGEHLKVRNETPWNTKWYLIKNGVVRNSGTLESGSTIKKNYSIEEGQRIGISVCPYWAGGSECSDQNALKS